MSFQNDDALDDPDFDLEALQEVVSTLTGRPFDPAKLTGHMLVAYRRLIVRGIRGPYDPHTEMSETFEEMRVAAPLLRMAGMQQPGVKILAPSFTGKSVGGRDYVVKLKARLGASTCSAVYVKLDSEGSVGSLAADILRGLGEPRPDSLTPDKRWARARRCIRDRKVDLLILDEFQRAGRRLTIHPVIAMKILDIMDEGDCAVAFVGKLNAKNIFKTTEDLGNRLDSPVSIGRLRWTTHQKEFIKFADAFDEALVKADVIKIKADLGDPAIAQLLLEASNGLIGQFSRIVETAVIAITREGRSSITMQDLSDAVDNWSIRNNRIDCNPFKGGIQIQAGNAEVKANEEEGEEENDERAEQEDGATPTQPTAENLFFLDEAMDAGEDDDGDDELDRDRETARG